jgi:undecaprenyl-diphosphatase
MTATRQPAAPEAPTVAGPEIVERSGSDLERSPVNVFALAVAVLTLLLFLAVAVLDRDALVGLEADTVALFHELPDPFERFLVGTSQFVALLYPVMLVVAFLASRRPRALLVCLVAGGLAALAVWGLETLIDVEHPPALAAAQDKDSWLLGGGFPDHVYVGVASALAVVVGAYVGRRWRHVAWAFVAVVIVLRIMSGTEVPVELGIAFAAGWACGNLALLAFGAPTHESTGRDIVAALTRCGFAVAKLAPASVDARGSTPWFATMTDDGRLFVKALGRDQRDADLLFRAYRFLRLRNVGDERPFSTLRRGVEHEALLALKARDAGVRTPHLRTVATVDPNGMLLAYEMIEGSSLDSVTEPWSDALLHAIWQQVRILRRERIAHRDLRRANLFVDPAGDVLIIDFGFSELAASDDMLDQDAAQLLASTAVAVGSERAVAAAVDVLGADEVGRSLRFLQMPAFAGATRAALHKNKGLLDEIRKAVIDATGTTEVQYEKLTRFSARTVLMLVCSLVAIYVLIPQLADVEGMVRQLDNANWGLVAAVFVFSFITYCGAAVSLVAACPVPVAYGHALEVSLAGSFVNRITPAGIGGIGLNVRFMQKAGANTTEAASRWGVNALAGGVVHISLAVLFLLWAGKENAFDFRLPEMPALVAVGILCVGAGVVFLVPYGRRKLLGPVRNVVKHAWTGVRDISRAPARLAAMFGGGSMVTLGYLFGLYAAVRAFGGTTTLAAVGAVYLAGSAIGQAAPTPGGLGAVEAVLIAGLVSVGLDKEIAVPAVLLFRLATFWAPILPGWLSFNSLTHHQEL